MIAGEEVSHPYCKPRDAAALILIDRSGTVPKVLVGKRHDSLVFMPGKFVFPGGRVDPADHRIPIARPLPDALATKLTHGAPKTAPVRARALAVAAIREVCEETGLCLGVHGTPSPSPALTGEWRPFADAGLLPDPSQLFLIARAITPPGRIRRYDTRFFTADISTIVHKVEGIVHPEAELVELAWIELGSSPLGEMHHITRAVLSELEARLAAGPLSHNADVPFFYYRHGVMRRDVI